MRHVDQRKSEIVGDRCANCGKPGPEHWQRPTWDEKGRYTCIPKEITNPAASEAEYIRALEALLVRNGISLPSCSVSCRSETEKKNGSVDQMR